MVFLIQEISDELKIPATTSFKYAHKVRVSKEFLSVLLSKRGGSSKRKSRLEEYAYLEGQKLVGQLTERDKILFASALYWAEGNKKDLIITNSDPEIIKIFLEVTRNILLVEEDNIWIGIRIYEELDIREVLSFWELLTGVSKSKISVSILAGKKAGKLRYGVCRIRIKKGGKILKKIVGINKAVVNQFKKIV